MVKKFQTQIEWIFESVNFFCTILRQFKQQRGFNPFLIQLINFFQVGGGAGAAGGGSTGSEAPGWPGMQSPHPHWPSAPAVATMTGVPAATPAPITAHPDYSAYHQVFTSVFFD